MRHRTSVGESLRRAGGITLVAVECQPGAQRGGGEGNPLLHLHGNLVVLSVGKRHVGFLKGIGVCAVGSSQCDITLRDSMKGCDIDRDVSG